MAKIFTIPKLPEPIKPVEPKVVKNIGNRLTDSTFGLAEGSFDRVLRVSENPAPVANSAINLLAGIGVNRFVNRVKKEEFVLTKKQKERLKAESIVVDPIVDPNITNNFDAKIEEPLWGDFEGLQVFDTFSFDSGLTGIQYQSDEKDGGGTTVLNAPFEFKTAILMVNQTKNIVSTAIAGRNGTVKEYMSEGDYILSLKGTLVGNLANKMYDKESVDLLMNYLKAPLTLPVKSSFLKKFNIDSVVVTDYNINQREGVRNIIDIDVSMLSDAPFDFGISEEVAGTQNATT